MYPIKHLKKKLFPENVKQTFKMKQKSWIPSKLKLVHKNPFSFQIFLAKFHLFYVFFWYDGYLINMESKATWQALIESMVASFYQNK